MIIHGDDLMTWSFVRDLNIYYYYINIMFDLINLWPLMSYSSVDIILSVRAEGAFTII